MAKPVGFDQKLTLSQLNTTANELRFTPVNKMYARLDELLEYEIKGVKSRKNAITILMKIWALGSLEHKHLQEQALDFYPDATQDEKKLLHWGLSLLAYPFFAKLVEETAHFLSIQKNVPAQQISRKMKASYGDRRRVEVATSAVLSSMKSWEVLAADKGRTYTVPQRIPIHQPDLKNWCVEVLFQLSEYQYLPWQHVASSMAFFPFALNLQRGELDMERFKVDRQGVDAEMVSVR